MQAGMMTVVLLAVLVLVLLTGAARPGRRELRVCTLEVGPACGGSRSCNR